MSRFKKGDKVVCVDVYGYDTAKIYNLVEPEYFISLYKIYEIVSTECQFENSIMIKDNTNEDHWYSTYRFELLSEYRIKVIGNILNEE